MDDVVGALSRRRRELRAQIKEKELQRRELNVEIQALHHQDVRLKLAIESAKGKPSSVQHYPPAAENRAQIEAIAREQGEVHAPALVDAGVYKNRKQANAALNRMWHHGLLERSGRVLKRKGKSGRSAPIYELPG